MSSTSAACCAKIGLRLKRRSRIMREVLLLALAFALGLTFQAPAQQGPLLIHLTARTGEDGSADGLMFTLLNADPNGAPPAERVLSNPTFFVPRASGSFNIFFDGLA